MMYRIARKNCDTEEERRTVKRITPQQLEAWGVISKVHGKWMGSNTYALLTGDPAFSIRLKCGLFMGDDKAVFLDRREFSGSVMSLIDEATFATQMNVYRIGAPDHGEMRVIMTLMTPRQLRTSLPELNWNSESKPSEFR